MRRGNRIFKYKGYMCKKSIYLQTHGVSLEGDTEVMTSGEMGLKGQETRELFTVYSCVLFGFLMHYFKK